MKLLLAALLVGPPSAPECPSFLLLRGVGTIVAAQVESYVRCLDSTIGTVEHLRAFCADARAVSSGYRGPGGRKADVDRAIRSLDAMAEERAACETELKVKP